MKHPKTALKTADASSSGKTTETTAHGNADPSVSVKEMAAASEAATIADTATGLDAGVTVQSPAANDLTAESPVDFTDGASQPHLEAGVGTLNGLTPLRGVGHGQAPSTTTNNPSEAALDPSTIGDDDDLENQGVEARTIDALRVEAVADRRRAGRRFRKGRVEHIPLSVLSDGDRRMIEADPLLSTRIERL